MPDPHSIARWQQVMLIEHNATVTAEPVAKLMRSGGSDSLYCFIALLLCCFVALLLYHFVILSLHHPIECKLNTYFKKSPSRPDCVLSLTDAAASFQYQEK